jgi:hypothetical protein
MTARPAPALLAALPAAPLFTLIGIALLPTAPGDAAGILDAVAADPGRWLAATVLSVVGQLLFVPAGVGLAGLFRSASSRVGVGAGVLMATTGALHIGVLGYTLAELPMSEVGAAAVAEEMFESPAFLVLLLPVLLTVYIGIALTAVAVWRTGLAPRWVPIALVVAPALEFVHDPFGSVATFALWTVAFGAIARQARRPDFAPAPTPAASVAA